MLALSRTALQLSPITRAALWILLNGSCSVMMNVRIPMKSAGHSD
jgi:hypothetical protein